MAKPPVHCEPAATIIIDLGGLTEVARVTDATLTTVQRWRLPTVRGGTGGFIPRKYHDRLIAHGATRGVDLTAASFLETTALGAA